MFTKTDESHSDLEKQGYKKVGKTKSGKHHVYKHEKTGHEVHREDKSEQEESPIEMARRRAPMNAFHPPEHMSGQDSHLLHGMGKPGGHAGYGRQS